jgi:hypothetical protein
MSGTTAFDAKTNLVALVEAAPAFADVDVWYGYEGGPDTALPRKVLWVGEIEWESEEYPLSGPTREETYRIAVTMESHNPGDTQQDANGNVKTMLQSFESLLRISQANRNPLSLTGIVSTEVIPQLLGEGQDSDGRGAIVVVLVKVKARK